MIIYDIRIKLENTNKFCKNWTVIYHITNINKNLQELDSNISAKNKNIFKVRKYICLPREQFCLNIIYLEMEIVFKL